MVNVPVSANGKEVYIQMDQDDVDRLERRKLSLGSHGYAQIWDNKHVMLVHRWVMGAELRDGRIVDHINRNRLDNRKSNLRFVNPSESSSNKAAYGISGYRGVHRNRKRWAAKGKKSGRLYHLGTYDSPEEAAAVAHAWRLENLPGYVGET